LDPADAGTPELPEGLLDGPTADVLGSHVQMASVL